MGKNCNLKQLKWIFKKAIVLIEFCENKLIDDSVAKEIEDYVDKVCMDSKNNAYCLDIMLDVLSAINRESKMWIYDSMPQELKDYANKRIKESGIVMVPGHYPVFESKEHVDKWIEMMQALFDNAKKD